MFTSGVPLFLYFALPQGYYSGFDGTGKFDNQGGKQMRKPFSIRIVTLFCSLFFVSATVRADVIYVGNFNDNTIVQFTSGGVGTTYATGSSGLNGPHGMAFDAAGNLFVANAGSSGPGSGSILKFTPGGISSVFANALGNPVGLAFDTAGNLYVGNADTLQILKITPLGVKTVFASTPSGGALNLAFDASGNLFVAIGGNNTIMKITPGGVSSVFANAGLNLPNGIAFDSSGNLYAANFGNDTIMKFTTGGVGSVFASEGLDRPTGLAFDSSGNLYVTNIGNDTIERYTSDGTGSFFSSTGLTDPHSIVIQSAVPEPTSFIFVGLCAAVAFCGWLVNRRKPLELVQ